MIEKFSNNSSEGLDISLINDSIDNVKSALEHVLYKSKISISCTRLDTLDFSLLPWPFERNIEVKRFIIWEPIMNPEQTVFVSNVMDGWLTLMNTLSCYRKIDIIKVSISSPKDSYPCNRYELIKCHDQQNQRVIYSMKEDNGWVFYQQGIPQKFEKIDNYQKRLKRDRLNRELVLEYTKMSGFDLNHINFWRSNSPILFFEVNKN